MSTNYGLVNRLVDSAARTPDGSLAKVRMNQYGEYVVSPLNALQLAAEGSLYVASNPVIGTGVAFTGRTTYTATGPAILVKNTDTIGGMDLQLTRLRLIVTSAGSITNFNTAVTVDRNLRYVSGGTQLVAANMRADDDNAGLAEIFTSVGTAIVTTADTADTRMISRSSLKTGTAVIGDTYQISFGADPQPETGASAGTTAAVYNQASAPCIIPPGCTAMIHFFGGNTSPSFEFTLEMVQR